MNMRSKLDTLEMHDRQKGKWHCVSIVCLCFDRPGRILNQPLREPWFLTMDTSEGTWNLNLYKHSNRMRSYMKYSRESHPWGDTEANGVTVPWGRDTPALSVQISGADSCWNLLQHVMARCCRHPAATRGESEVTNWCRKGKGSFNYWRNCWKMSCFIIINELWRRLFQGICSWFVYLCPVLLWTLMAISSVESVNHQTDALYTLELHQG